LNRIASQCCSGNCGPGLATNTFDQSNTRVAAFSRPLRWHLAERVRWMQGEVLLVQKTCAVLFLNAGKADFSSFNKRPLSPVIHSVFKSAQKALRGALIRRGEKHPNHARAFLAPRPVALSVAGTGGGATDSRLTRSVGMKTCSHACTSPSAFGAIAQSTIARAISATGS